jgi:hypothetical protein
MAKLKMQFGGNKSIAAPTKTFNNQLSTNTNKNLVMGCQLLVK